MKKLFVLFTACLFVFTLSCKFNSSPAHESVQVEKEEYDLVTPYSEMDAETLISLKAMGTEASAADPDVVDWKVARFFAVVEKIKFENFYQTWTGAKVSGKPVIIYYPESNKPKYYEFRVIKDGKEVGSITCHASKSEGDFVAYISEMTHKVTPKVAKELVSLEGNYRLAAVNYPNNFVMRERDICGLENSDFKDAASQISLTAEKIFIEKPVDVLLKEASAETLVKMGVTEEGKAQMLAEISERKAMFAELWADVDKSKEKILAITDEEIEDIFGNSVSSAMQSDPGAVTIKNSWIEENQVYWNEASNWYNKIWWHNPGGWCSPAVLTFVTLGLGKKSNFPNIPVTNDIGGIDAMYERFEKELRIKPKVPRGQEIVNARILPQLNTALRNLTNYEIKILQRHWWSDIDNHIDDNLPVISLRSGWYGDWGYHYRTVVATIKYEKRIHNEIWWYWFGWKSHRWSTYLSTSYWYYMHDNGSDTKTRWNKHVKGNKEYGNFLEKSWLGCHFMTGLVKHK